MIPTKQLKRRMKMIQPHSRAYFLKSEGSIRFCHIEHNEYKYLSFPFCDFDRLQLAAQLLKDCGIVDGYRSVKVSDERFYIELFQYRYRRHVTAAGKTLHCSVRQLIEWQDLKLTQYDAQHFIARFQLPVMQASTPPVHPPVRISAIPMYSQHKKAA